MAKHATTTEMMRAGRCVLCGVRKEDRKAKFCDRCNNDPDGVTVLYCPDCGVTHDAAVPCNCDCD